jgi:hypothetical protein
MQSNDFNCTGLTEKSHEYNTIQWLWLYYYYWKIPRIQYNDFNCTSLLEKSQEYNTMTLIVLVLLKNPKNTIQWLARMKNSMNTIQWHCLY